MKQSIKKTNQSAKILKIYAKCLIHRFNSNNNLLHTRLIPINIFNKYTTSDYTRTHYITPKNELFDFLEFVKRFKVSEMREREFHNYFYTD